MLSQVTKDTIYNLYILSNSIDKLYYRTSFTGVLAVDLHLLSTIYNDFNSESFSFLQILPHASLLTLLALGSVKKPMLIDNVMVHCISLYQKMTNAQLKSVTVNAHCQLLKSFRSCFSNNIFDSSKPLFWHKDGWASVEYTNLLKRKNELDDLVRVLGEEDESYIKFLTFLKKNNKQEELCTLANLGANPQDWNGPKDGWIEQLQNLIKQRAQEEVLTESIESVNTMKYSELAIKDPATQNVRYANEQEAQIKNQVRERKSRQMLL